MWNESWVARMALSRHSLVWTLPHQGCRRSLQVEMPQGRLGQELLEWLLVLDPGLVAHDLRWGVWHESLVAAKVLSRHGQEWTLI